MIILDIESSGLDSGKCGIWQIGALELENSDNYFLEEGRIDDEDLIEEGALKVTGKTESELRDKKKQSQKQLIENFFKWVEKRKLKNFLCQNPQFDVAFIDIKARKYGLKMPFHYRSFDLHSIAQTKYFELNRKFLINNDHSDMGLTNILNFCGLPDERMRLEDNRSGEINIIQKGKTHNALEDCKLEGECFSRIRDGKNLFPEFLKFKIPKELAK